MPTNVDDKIASLDPAKQETIAERVEELKKEIPPIKEVLVVFTNITTTTGPRVRARVFSEGKTKTATSRMTARGISKLREWARGHVGDAKMNEMVQIPISSEEKLIREATIALEPRDPMAMKLAHASFPDYQGRKFKVNVVPEGTSIDVTSYWQDGSRDYYAILNLSTMRSMQVPQNGDPHTKRIAPVKIHENMCVVQHSIFVGKDAGLTFIISEKNAAQLLPSNDNNLDKKEKTVLVLLRSLKPAYRRDEANKAGISAQEYEQIVANLKVKQYVNSGGAITAKGKNAVSGIRDLYQLRNEKMTVQSKPVQEKALTEATSLLQKIKANRVFVDYVAYLALTGYKLLRYGGSSKPTADWNIAGVGDLYIEGNKWEIQGHIKGTRINPTGDSLESLDEFLDQNNI